MGAVDTGWCLGVALGLKRDWLVDMKLGRTEIKENGYARCSLQQEIQSNRKGIVPSSRLSLLYNPSG